MTKNEFQALAKQKTKHELMVMFNISRYIVSFWSGLLGKKPKTNIFPYPLDPKVERRKLERQIIRAPLKDLEDPRFCAKTLRQEFKEKCGIWPEKAK